MSILRENVVADESADNATALAVYDAKALEVVVLLGVMANFSAAVAAIKDIVVSYTDPSGAGKTITISHDFTNGTANYPFPAPIATKAGTVSSISLAASGTGGVTGRAYLFAGKLS